MLLKISIFLTSLILMFLPAKILLSKKEINEIGIL